MHFPTALALSLAGTLAAAVDMASYQAGMGVEQEFAEFVQEYYRIQEDKHATTTFLDMWTPDAVMVLQGTEIHGPDAMLAMRNKLLPANATPSKDWWHVIQSAEVDSKDESTKTYLVTMIVQTTYTPGNCSQAHGKAKFSIRRDAIGLTRLDPHWQNLAVYDLTMNTVESPTSEACT
ncbi:unnamed protein product [Discula destructiva]